MAPLERLRDSDSRTSKLWGSKHNIEGVGPFPKCVRAVTLAFIRSTISVFAAPAEAGTVGTALKLIHPMGILPESRLPLSLATSRLALRRRLRRERGPSQRESACPGA